MSLRSFALSALCLSGLAFAGSSPLALAADAVHPSSQSPIRGVVRPVHQAVISSELSARVIKVARREGEAFAKGELLVEFDCRRHHAEFGAAEAHFREMKLVLESNTYLQRNQAGAKLEVEVSRARADKGGAEADALKARLDQCRLLAPFDGRVAELGVSEYETPAPGKPLLTILDDSALEIELIVPSTWLRCLQPGTSFSFDVDETGARLSSQITRIGAAVDAVSQTIKVVGNIVEERGKVLAGMSGTATFAREGL
jgi:membrane fusion protein, multidrug efflux system